MHIPDGYLSPIFALGTGAITVPTWALAVNRVRSVLNNRTVPLLAILSAFSFTIMMFNIPVPGGTTAHAVGGTLLAIILGPWAAVIGISTALIIQALFFGDGGVLAIFINCLNLAIVLPLVGYYCYRLLAGRSPVLSARRIWAAGIAAYVGMGVAALLVGIELGLQPLLFQEGGRALYNPYPLSVTIPAMLATHLFGASLVEGLITALGLAYIQKQYPQYLTSLRTIVSGTTAEAGEPQRVPLWQLLLAGTLVTLGVLLVSGLITAGGDITHLFGVNWAGDVHWPEVGFMLLLVAVLAVVLIPLAWFLLPRAWRKIGTVLIAFAVFAPLGLIAPGFAFGEGDAASVEAAFGYVPAGLRQWSEIFSAPFTGYNLQLPFFNDANVPLWRAALGYEVSGIIGILLLGAVIIALALLLRRFSLRDTSRLSSVNES